MNKTMVKRTLALVVSAIATSTAFVGCTDYSEFSEADMKFDQYNKLYDEAFVDRFGTPDANHTWGMRLLESFTPNDFMTTRAGDATTHNVNVNRNQWCERDNNGFKDADYVLAKSIKIPGWPNDDGYYYVNKGEGALTDIVGKNQINSDYNWQPAGDVTEYEINYVSTWFRTHKNPGKISLHLSDFFIQNVSQDNDQLEYKGYVDCHKLTIPQGLGEFTPTTGKNQWWNGDNANVVSDVVKDGTYDEIKPGVAAIVNRNQKAGHPNSNEALQFSMDYLHFRSMDGNEYSTKTSWTPDNGWTHINNFNNGNSNIDPENKDDKGFREIKYVHSSGTEDFIARCAMGSNDQNWINNWVLVKLEWDEPMNGKTVHREGYYLAFDFENSTSETIIKADGFYSNWIVKITPAYNTRNDKYNARIMCEDLGGSYDFDYNDIVFDVSYDQKNGGNGEAVICIMASGGTLPIVVGDVDKEKYEAHRMLGQKEGYLPVNVDAENGMSADVAIYRVPVQSGWVNNNKLDFYQIPIYVDLNKNNHWIDTNINVHQFDEDHYDAEYGTPSDKIDDTKDKTPRKFATAVGVSWMKENKSIDDGYEKFKKWVQKESYTYEVSKDDSDNKITLNWYNDYTNDDFIHDGGKDPVTPEDDKEQSQTHWLRMTEYPVTADFTNKGYAVDLLTIKGYEGANSVYKKLDGGHAMATFAFIVKSPKINGQDGVHGLILPIWIIDGKPHYVKPDGTEIEISPTGMLSRIESYKPAVWQSSFNRSGTDGNTIPTEEEAKQLGQGVDMDNNYTFVIKYGYAKAHLFVKPESESAARYCDYMGLYIYENRNNSNNYNNGAPNITEPVKMFEAYTIF